MTHFPQDGPGNMDVAAAFRVSNVRRKGWV